jgi:hypothetical protein
MRFTVPASLAVCMSPLVPDPSECGFVASQNTVIVTHLDVLTMTEWNTYLRFDIDPAIRARSIIAASLELTATSTNQAASDDSGVVWQTQPFTLMSIDTGSTPAKVGTTAIAPSQGAVAKAQTVSWPLPTTLVGDTLCVEVQSPSIDTVAYWSTGGTTPPLLAVDAY